MRKLLIISFLIFSSSFSYSQLTAVSIVNKYEKPILRTDSIILKTDGSTLRKGALPAGNFRICTPSRACLVQKPLLYIFKYRKWEKRLTDTALLNFFNPNDVEKIEIPKIVGLVEEYGHVAKYGVIIITLKSNKALEYEKKFEEFKAAIK